MKGNELTGMAQSLVAAGKGILAADETVPTVTKRLAARGIESTEQSRRDYRELFFTTAGIADFISGVILQDETIHQTDDEETPLVELLLRQQIIPGIKVDDGVIAFPGSPGEHVTEGLDGLRTRLEHYRSLGARFAKWRAVFSVSDRVLPTTLCVRTNVHALARYAAFCQEADIVPIVEPEVLMDGAHTIERCEEVTGHVLHALFDELYQCHVALDGMLLKPNMIIAGKGCPQQAAAKDVAIATLRCLRRHVPAAVPGIAFLSGGQDPLQSVVNLNAINQVAQLGGRPPWRLSFSYGRALQDEALRAWRQHYPDAQLGQQAFYHRSRCAGAAAVGAYTTSMEVTEPSSV